MQETWIQQLSLPVNIGIFLVAAALIAWIGARLSRIADLLADHTGVGEALAGALFLGASTSLPGIITSVTVAAQGHPSMAVSNAVGGIAAQTAFLVVADLTHRPANLEHAAASASNILQAALLIALLTVPLVAMSTPEITFFGVHPATPVMLAAYWGGLMIIRRGRADPMWHPHQTRETRPDVPEEGAQQIPAVKLWSQFALTGIAVGACGFAVAQSGLGIAKHTGLSETAVGGFLTAVSTSLPELVTAIAAVRQGALTLAVGGIIGGNAFDTLFLAVSDAAYLEGSIYHTIGQHELFMISVGILMTASLLMGMVRRERSGIGNIGFEGLVILTLYVTSAVYIFADSSAGTP